MKYIVIKLEVNQIHRKKCLWEIWKKTIANIHKFMTKRNSRMAVLPNRTYKVAAPLVRAYGGKRQKTLKKR